LVLTHVISHFLRFFQNKGEVAGVFTVVGLLALVLIIALITNAIRRRQAEKFDREVALAAAEAAANTRGPDLDDDYGYPGSGMGGSGVSGGMGGDYSDTTSHGTYSQQPMSHQYGGGGADMYGMREFGPGVGGGQGFDPYSSAATAMGGAAVAMGGPGAAGIGAAALNRSRSQTAPYNAFAGPPSHNPTQPMMPDAFAPQTSHGL